MASNTASSSTKFLDQSGSSQQTKDGKAISKRNKGEQIRGQPNRKPQDPPRLLPCSKENMKMYPEHCFRIKQNGHYYKECRPCQDRSVRYRRAHGLPYTVYPDAQEEQEQGQRQNGEQEVIVIEDDDEDDKEREEGEQ